MKITVLGAGMVGGPIAIDLARGKGFAVVSVDIDDAALDRLRSHGIETRHADLRDAAAIGRWLRGCDLVVNAVPGSMGFATLKAAIEEGKHVVDIAFFPEDPFALDDLAKERGVTAIVDCGVAPGMSHLLAGYADHLLDETESVLILVGGLPLVREKPWEYKAVFSPIDVIEEYTRPARFVEKGKIVTRPALSDPEEIEFPGLGTLEAFNTDGLRSLLRTLHAPEMKEKTLRYPGHIEKIALLRDTGFFGLEEIDIHGRKVRPIDVTVRLLFPQWKLRKGEVDVTVMRVVVRGKSAGKPVEHRFELFDRYDEATATHSMARTTGYTATAAVRMLAAGLFAQRGIVPPEFIGREPGCVDFMLKDLAARHVVYSHKVMSG